MERVSIIKKLSSMWEKNSIFQLKLNSLIKIMEYGLLMSLKIFKWN